MHETLEKVYKQDSSITFTAGRRDSGKTSISLLLMEKGREKGFFNRLASNIATRNDPRVDYICYSDRFEDWLKLDGRKAFGLDELGKHLYRMNFMSKKAQMILEVCQLVRKYDAHLFGCAPSTKLVNSLFWGTDLLDVFIYKLSRKKARVNILTTGERFTLKDIPDTSIKFVTKDIARFDMKDPSRRDGSIDTLENWQKASQLYLKHRSLRKVANIMGVSHQMIKYWLDYAVKQHFIGVNE